VSNSELIPIINIRLDGGTQPRAALDFDAVEDYAEAMGAGATFPPVTVFYDGTDYWLADGFHRVKAAYAAGHDTIACEVHQGTVNDAQWYSFSANRTNGLRRTNQDKQRAVKAALIHAKSCGLSDQEIARHVGVDAKTVGNWREKLTLEFPESAKRTGRDGRTINVARIGKRPPSAHPAPGEPPPTAATADPDPSSPVPPPAGRTTRQQRIDRLARLRLSFLESTKRLAHLVGWLGETHGDFEQAELLLSNASAAVAAVITEIERKALAADPLNASRLEIEENLS